MCYILLSYRMINYKGWDHISLDLPRIIVFGVRIMEILDLRGAADKPGLSDKPLP
jgi:hypothetical protein